VSAGDAGGEGRLRGKACGLDIEAGFELLGIAGPPEYDGSRPVGIEVVSDESLDEVVGTPADRLVEVPGSGGRPLVAVDASRGGGFILRADGFGTAWMSADGGRILCVPVAAPGWRWQRFLTGQVLPFAAVLRGLEVFHASAVALDDSCVAIVAGSGVGKTSLALNLALRGFSFVNDDVLVIEARDGAPVLAHPGPGLANVRLDESGLVERIEQAGLARRRGTTETEVRIELARHGRPVRPSAIYFVERAAVGDRQLIERLSPIEPRMLLAATFNLALRTPDRLARQLEACGRLADSCAMFRVVAPPDVEAPTLAAEIQRTALALEPQPS